MTVSYVPLGLAILFYFIFLKQSLRVLFLFVFFAFAGDIQWKFLRRRRRKEPGGPCLCAELVPIPVPRGGGRRGRG